jgi:hypothetical protein
LPEQIPDKSSCWSARNEEKNVKEDMMASNIPAWTSEQIMAARKVYRKNGSLADAMGAMGERVLTKDGCRKKLTALGMKFYDMPSTHRGTSKISNPSYKANI